MGLPLKVNDAVDRLAELDGSFVAICGILNIEFENTSLLHYPKIERRERTLGSTEPSSLWLVEHPNFKPNSGELSQWHSRRVIVKGVLRAAEAGSGCGHFSLWPGEIEVQSVERE